jgi:dethiobiotin synthetase
MRGFSIVGIGTDVGKTVVSAIIAEALGAAYFKPIQAGDLDNSDSQKVGRWCSEKVTVFPEAFRLSTPMAPHGAAEIDGIEMSVGDIVFPQTHKPLILEGAGGLLVPLNKKETFAAIYKQSGLPAIVVSRHYLGSINHTLLTIESLKANEIPIAGIIYVGDENKPTESVIAAMFDLKELGRVVLPKNVDKDFVQNTAKDFEVLLYEL